MVEENDPLLHWEAVDWADCSHERSLGGAYCNPKTRAFRLWKDHQVHFGALRGVMDLLQ